MIEFTEGFGDCVEKLNRDERMPLGLTTSIPKLPGLAPRLITIVKELGDTLSICDPLSVPTFVPEPLNTSTVRLNWKLLPLTWMF